MFKHLVSHMKVMKNNHALQLITYQIFGPVFCYRNYYLKDYEGQAIKQRNYFPLSCILA